MEWYKFTPVDTLFFRGAEPMNIGENHTASHVFPPPAHTLSGALRTTVLRQNNVSFKDYGIGMAPAEIIAAIGKAGQAAPFSLIGPLFILAKDVYVPAPYSWFMEKHHKKMQDSAFVKVVKGVPIKSRLLKSEYPDLLWAKGETNETASLGGNWIKQQDLHSPEESIEVKTSGAFFDNEPRTGIALEKSRKVRQSHLYSFNHARLKKEACLLFGSDKHLPLADKGVLKIGAEQRFGWYEKLAGETRFSVFQRRESLFDPFQPGKHTRGKRHHSRHGKDSLFRRMGSQNRLS